MKTTLLVIIGIVALLAYYVLFGVVFADLWNMSFAAVGLPAVTAYQAVVGWLLVGMIVYKRREVDADIEKIVTDLAARFLVLLATWGTAHLLGWWL